MKTKMMEGKETLTQGLGKIPSRSQEKDEGQVQPEIGLKKDLPREKVPELPQETGFVKQIFIVYFLYFLGGRSWGYRVNDNSLSISLKSLICPLKHLHSTFNCCLETMQRRRRSIPSSRLRKPARDLQEDLE